MSHGDLPSFLTTTPLPPKKDKKVEDIPDFLKKKEDTFAGGNISAEFGTSSGTATSPVEAKPTQSFAEKSQGFQAGSIFGQRKQKSTQAQKNKRIAEKINPPENNPFGAITDENSFTPDVLDSQERKEYDQYSNKVSTKPDTKLVKDILVSRNNPLVVSDRANNFINQDIQESGLPITPNQKGEDDYAYYAKSRREQLSDELNGLAKEYALNRDENVLPQMEKVKNKLSEVNNYLGNLHTRQAFNQYNPELSIEGQVKNIGKEALKFQDLEGIKERDLKDKGLASDDRDNESKEVDSFNEEIAGLGVIKEGLNEKLHQGIIDQNTYDEKIAELKKYDNDLEKRYPYAAINNIRDGLSELIARKRKLSGNTSKDYWNNIVTAQPSVSEVRDAIKDLEEQSGGKFKVSKLQEDALLLDLDKFKLTGFLGHLYHGSVVKGGQAIDNWFGGEGAAQRGNTREKSFQDASVNMAQQPYEIPLLNEDGKIRLGSNAEGGKKADLFSTATLNNIGETVGTVINYSLGNKGFGALGTELGLAGTGQRLFSNTLAATFLNHHESVEAAKKFTKDPLAQQAYATATDLLTGLFFSNPKFAANKLLAGVENDAQKSVAQKFVQAIKESGGKIDKEKFAPILAEWAVATGKDLKHNISTIKGLQMANIALDELVNHDANRDRDYGEEVLGSLPLDVITFLPLSALTAYKTVRGNVGVRNVVREAIKDPVKFEQDMLQKAQDEGLNMEETKKKIEYIKGLAKTVNSKDMQGSKVQSMPQDKQFEYAHNLATENGLKEGVKEVTDKIQLDEHKKETAELQDERKAILDGKQDEYTTTVDIHDRIDEKKPTVALGKEGTKTKVVEFWQDQALSNPNSTKKALKGDVELTTDLIARNPIDNIKAEIKDLKEKHKKAVESENYKDADDLDRHITLLEAGLDKKKNTKLSEPIEGIDEQGVPIPGKETNEQKIQSLIKELESITDDNNPRIAEIDAELTALEQQTQSGVATGAKVSEDKNIEKVITGDEITVGEMIDKVGTYKGEKGRFYQDNQAVVFKVDGKNKEYELGRVDDIKNEPISGMDIQHEQSIVTVNDLGNIEVRGKQYANNFSDPRAAINYDADGKIISVNLETPEGKKRTFRGNIAEDIAYQIHLKEITKDNETTTKFEDFINAEDNAKAINEGLPKITPEESTGNNGEVQKPERIKVDQFSEVRKGAAEVKMPVYKNIFAKGSDADIKSALKDVSDQWHDEGTRVQAERDFGSTIVKEAKKLYPQETKKSLQPLKETTKAELSITPIEEVKGKELGSGGVGGDVEATTKALDDIGRTQTEEGDIIDKILLQKSKDLREEDGTVSDKNLKEFKDVVSARASINAAIAIRPKAQGSKERYVLSNKEISEAYHKAKADGTNPELLKAVEQSLKDQPKAETKNNEQEAGSVGVGGDVEATAKALEEVSKTKPTLWEKIKDAIKSVGNKLGIVSNADHINNFNKAKAEWDKLSSREKKLKRADYELDDLHHTEGGYYKVGNSLIDLDLNPNHFKILLENNKFLNILNKLGVTKIHSENRPPEEMFAHYSDGIIHLNNNSAFETEEQLSFAMSHELGHHEWTKLTKEERDYVRSLPLETGMAKHYEAQEKNGGKQTSASLQEENFADYVMQYFQGKLYGDEALLNKIPAKLRVMFDNKYSDLLKDNEHSDIAEAYHKAKADGSNPELVKAVEQSLKETTKAETTTTNVGVEEGSGGVGGNVVDKNISTSDEKGAVKGNTPTAAPAKSIIGGEVDLKGGKKDAWMFTPKEHVKLIFGKLYTGKEEPTQEVVDHAKQFVQKAIDAGDVKSAIKEGRISVQDAKTIIESAGLEVPEDIAEQSLKETTIAGSGGVGGEVKYSFKGENKIKGEAHEGLNKEEAINRILTDLLGTVGASRRNSTIESQINKLEEWLMRPDNDTRYVKQSTIDSYKNEIKELKELQKQGFETFEQYAESKLQPEQPLKETTKADAKPINENIKSKFKKLKSNADEKKPVIKQAKAVKAIEDKAADAADNKSPEAAAEVIKEIDEIINQTPEQQARNAGQKEIDGTVVKRQEPLQNIVEGKPVDILFTKDDKETGNYAVIERADMQPSHKSGVLNENHFIPEAQPRDRGALEVLKNEAKNKADKLDPNQLADNNIAYFGAPVVNERGEVIQGNGRAEAIDYYYGNDQGDTKGYKEMLQEKAASLGLDGDAIAKMKEPVLVKLTKASDERAIQLGNYTAGELEDVKQRGADVKAAFNRLTPAKVKELSDSIGSKVDETTTLKQIIRDNIKVVLDKLFDLGALRKDNKEQYIRNGEVTPEGIQAAYDIVRQLLFEGGASDLQNKFDELPSRVREAIEKTIPAILGNTELKSKVQEAIEIIREQQESGIDAFATWRIQRDIFGDQKMPADKYDKALLDFAQGLTEAGTQKAIAEKIIKISQAMNGAPATLWDAAVPPKRFDEAYNQTGIKFAISMDGSSDLSQMKAIVKEIQNDYADKDENISLDDIKAIAKNELGSDYDEQLVEQAYHEAGKENRAFKKATAIQNELAKRVQEFTGSETIVLPNSDALKAKAEELQDGVKFQNDNAIFETRDGNKLNNVWSGVVDLRDGNIDKSFTLKQAKEHDFHHTFLVGDSLDAISNGEKAYFWIQDGEPMDMENTLTSDIKNKIKEQIKNKKTFFQKEGEIFGFTHDKIYLNGEHLNPNTPIHEAGHIWVEVAKEKMPLVYKKGIELVNGSMYLKNAKADEFYQAEAAKLPKAERKAYFEHEALAAAIGDKGAQFITEARRKSFIDWAKDLWTKIAEAVGFKGITSKQMENMTLDEFAKRAAVDILKGKEPMKEEAQPEPEPKEKPDKNAPVELSHGGMQDIADAFDLPDVKVRDRVSDIQEMEDAKSTVKQWNDEGKYPEKIDKIINDAIESKGANSLEKVILALHIANVKAEANAIKNIYSKEYDVKVKELERVKRAAEMLKSTAAATTRTNSLLVDADPTMADWMAERKESLEVDELTNVQKEDIKNIWDEYETNLKTADDKITQAEQEVAKLKAELATKTERQKRNYLRSKNQGNLKAERENIIKNIQDKLKKARGETSAKVVPYANELFSIAPDVLKLVTNLIDSGVTKLADIVDNIHGTLVDSIKDITKQDVHNIIAGEYNDKRPTLTELQYAKKDIVEEARLINKLEALQNGEFVKDEKQQRKRNKEIYELRGKIKQYRNYDQSARTPEQILNAIKKRNEARKKEIDEKILNKDYSTKPKPVPIDENKLLKQANPKLWAETMDAINAREESGHKFEKLKYEDELQKRTMLKKWVVDPIGKGITTAKAIKAGIDDSVTMVQLMMAVYSNPRAGFKAKIAAFQDVNNTHFKRRLAALHNSVYWPVIFNSGLDITEPQSFGKKEVEELYSGNLFDDKFRIPFTKLKFNPWTYTGGIFERIFTSMGNNLRLNLFYGRIAMLEGQGKTFESHPEEYKGAARAINELTGRGKVADKLQGSMDAISPIIWAPKMLASTFNTLGVTDLVAAFRGKKGVYREIPPQQARYLGWQMAKGIGMGVAVMAALALRGWGVDRDPRSTTFGNVISPDGNRRYNVFGRFGNLVKTIVQLAGGTKVSSTGNEIDMDKSMGGRGKALIGFWRGKMTPATGIFADYWLNSKTNYFTKQPINLKSLPGDLIAPISFSALTQGLHNDGIMSLLTRFLPELEGIQVSDKRDYKTISTSLSEKSSKFLKDHDISVPYFNPKQIPIKQMKNGVGEMKKLSDFDEATQIKYEKTHSQIFDQELSKLKTSFVFKNAYGNISFSSSNSKDKKIWVKDLTNKDMKEFISLIKEKATEKTKETLFKEYKK